MCLRFCSATNKRDVTMLLAPVKNAVRCRPCPLPFWCVTAISVAILDVWTIAASLWARRASRFSCRIAREFRKQTEQPEPESERVASGQWVANGTGAVPCTRCCWQIKGGAMKASGEKNQVFAFVRARLVPVSRLPTCYCNCTVCFPAVESVGDASPHTTHLRSESGADQLSVADRASWNDWSVCQRWGTTRWRASAPTPSLYRGVRYWLLLAPEMWPVSGERRVRSGGDLRSAVSPERLPCPVRTLGFIWVLTLPVSRHVQSDAWKDWKSGCQWRFTNTN